MKVFTAFFAIILLLAILSESYIQFTEAVKLRNNKNDESKTNKKKKKSTSSSTGTTPPADHPEPPKKKPAAPKKKKAASTTDKTGTPSNFKPGKPKYVEIVDLAIDHAKGYCSTLGPLIQRPRFSWKRRCDVFYEAVEMFITGFSDTMINEFDLTQQEMVNRAMKPMKLVELRGALKAVARRALESIKTDEKKLQTHLNARLSQWVMNTAIGNEGGANSGGGQSFSGGMGGFGGGIDTQITDEDKYWAEEVSADDYEDDPEKDDPDYIHKNVKAGGGGGGMPGGMPGGNGGGGGMPDIKGPDGKPLPKDKVEKMMQGMQAESKKREEMLSEESEDV